MTKQRYVTLKANTIGELEQVVSDFLDDAPVFEPTGGPFHVIDGTPGGTWYQAVYWKE